MKLITQFVFYILFLIGLWSCQKKSSKFKLQTSRPNILIIYADDLGYGDLSCYGGDIPTPNIDRIGQEGIRFTDFYVSSPACTPSRFSLLTGAYPHRSKHGLDRVIMPVIGEDRYLDISEHTIAEYLQSNGYRTSIFGKWHLGVKNVKEGKLDIYGFDEFAGCKGGCIDYFSHVYGQLGHDWYVHGKEEREEGYSTTLITDHAIDFIDRVSNKEKPFFVYIPYNAPHFGKTDPDEFAESTSIAITGVDTFHGIAYINTLQAPKEYIQQYSHIQDRYKQVYRAMVSCMDDNIGRILNKLEEKKLLDNTIIWLMSDNGAYSSDKYHGYASNGELRGGKGDMWEGGIRVPALLLWKNKIPQGQVVKVPVCNVDVLPTLLSVLGISLNVNKKEAIDGIDLTPVIFENKNITRSILSVYGGKRNAIRIGKWKLIDQKQLFNLEIDPDESNDVSEQYPDVVQKMKMEYEQLILK